MSMLLLVVVLLTGCTSPPPEPVAPAAPAAPAPTATATDHAITAQEGLVEHELVDAQLAVVLMLLDPTIGPGSTMDESTYVERFTSDFRTEVPLEELNRVLEGFKAVGPYEVTTEIARNDVGELLVRVMTGDGVEMAISLFVTSAGQISGLLFTPGDPPTLDTPVSTLDEAVDELASRGELRLVAGPVEAGACEPDAALAPDEQAPVGSAISLYVLGAVVDAIAEGALSWDTRLVLTSEVMSLPPGVLQDRPDRSPVTVQEAVELMVQVSDNTAADLLLSTVGRAAVEEAQARWAHSAPARNIPFMTTRELFALKVADAEVQQAWLAGDEPARRAVLDDLTDADLPPASALLETVRAPDTLGWFAAPQDLCRVLVGLLDRSDDPGLEPLAEILTANPGVPDPDGRWARIANARGAEPGLLASAWVVEDADGGRFALAASLVDPDAPLEDIQTILLMGAARDLLGG